MKKKIALLVVLFAVTSIVFAQSAQRRAQFVGTWSRVVFERDSPSTWIFNADGTLTMDGAARKWIITENYLFVAPWSQGGGGLLFEYELSSDGRTLILKGSQNYCLVKQ